MLVAWRVMVLVVAVTVLCVWNVGMMAGEEWRWVKLVAVDRMSIYVMVARAVVGLLKMRVIFRCGESVIFCSGWDDIQ